MDEQHAAPDSGQLSAMVERAEAGDANAKDALFASLYNELHRAGATSSPS